MVERAGLLTVLLVSVRKTDLPAPSHMHKLSFLGSSAPPSLTHLAPLLDARGTDDERMTNDDDGDDNEPTLSSVYLASLPNSFSVYLFFGCSSAYDGDDVGDDDGDHDAGDDDGDPAMAMATATGDQRTALH